MSTVGLGVSGGGTGHDEYVFGGGVDVGNGLGGDVGAALGIDAGFSLGDNVGAAADTGSARNR
jgi:hypothetical protein